MAIAFGGTKISKAYLGATEIQKMYLGSTLVFDNNVVSLRPIMTNFRIENDYPDRVYFDTPLGPVTGIEENDFIWTGSTSPYEVNTVDNYFSFAPGTKNYWNKALTVRQENGNGVVSDFKMESVYNLIDEPDATIDRYVTVAGGGNGESLGSPWTLSEACANADQGMTIHVAKGDYGSGNFVVTGFATATNPIKFIGYDTTPGDNPTHVRTPGLVFDANVMPLIQSGSTSGNGFSTADLRYIIVKNIQVDGYNYAINMDEGEYQVFDNVYATGAATGINCEFAQDSTALSVINSFTSNCTGFGLNMSGIGHLVDNHYSACSYDVGMDYQITMNASGIPNSGQHIVRNSYIERSLDQASHTGHGLTFYATYTRTNTYSLAENLEIVNVRQAIENRGHGVQHCVYRDIECHQTAEDPTYGSSIVIAMTTTSARYGHFERINAHGYAGGNGIETAIRFLSSGDDPNAEDNGRYNTFANCVFDDVTYAVRTAAQGDGGDGEVPFDNTIINCTFNDVTRMFYAENPDNGTGNKLVNCIIQNAPSKFADNGNTSAWTFENTLFWNWWGVNGTPESGIDNISVNPDLNAEYQPQAPFSTISVPLYPGVYYDEHKSERQDPTTVGSISSSEEAPSEPTDELVIDGEFAFNDTYWDIAGGTSSITNNEATIVTTGAYTYLSQDNVMVTGEEYTVEFDVIATNGETLASDLDEIVWDTSTVGHKVQVITAPEARLMFKRRVGSTDTDITLDNISVKLGGTIAHDTRFNESVYAVTVMIPPYDSGNAAHKLISTVGDLSDINDPTLTHFYIEPGDYTSIGAGGRVNLTASGTSGAKRYISLYNGNDTHPGKLTMDTSNLAKLGFYITGDYWVIDRISQWDSTDSTIANYIDTGNYNIFNRYFIDDWDGIGIVLYPESNNNVVQNCRVQREGITLNRDAPAFGLSNQGLDNVTSANNIFVQNEVYNRVDAFQSIKSEAADQLNTNYEGTIVDANHMYIDNTIYTDGLGNADPNGDFAMAENAIDLKGGSKNPANPMIITNNACWGFRKSDATGTSLSSNGQAITTHYDVWNTIIDNNLVYDSQRAIALGYYDNGFCRNNIVVDTRGFTILANNSVDVTVSGNLLKNSCILTGDSWQMQVMTDMVFSVNMTVTDNGGTPYVATSTITKVDNIWYDAIVGAIGDPSDIFPATDPTANYEDIKIYTDRFTNNPWVLTVEKVKNPTTPPIYGPELVTNGTFDTDTSGWDAEANALLSVDTQRLKIEVAGGAGSSYARQRFIPTVIGTTYALSADGWVGTSDRLRLYTAETGFIDLTVDGSWDTTFVAATTETQIRCYAYGLDGVNGFFDNISLKEVL